MVPQGNSDDSKPLALHNGINVPVIVHLWVCVPSACMCSDMYTADFEQECMFYNTNV